MTCDHCTHLQGLPEAAASSEVFKFTCQARSQIEEVLELPLEGLGHLTGNEEFTHTLDIPANKQSALRNALHVEQLPGELRHAGDHLK